jgi:hypothetical protein
MWCYITCPAIGILVVSDNGYFLFYSTVVFLSVPLLKALQPVAFFLQ